MLIEYPFTREFAGLSPEKFVEGILIGKLGARVIVVGSDFRFGKDRQGDVDTLRYLADDCDYQLIVMDKLKKDGYTFITLNDLYNRHNNRIAIVTFDDCYEDVYYNAYPYLKDQNIPFFAVHHIHGQHPPYNKVATAPLMSWTA